MNKFIKEIISFYKNPQDIRSSDISFKSNIRAIINTIILDILISIPIIIALIFIMKSDLLPIDSEYIDYNSNTIWTTILSIVILVPLLEEITFRLPLRYNWLYSKLITRKTWGYFFRILVYIFPFIFGYVHLTNFGKINSTLILLSPILVGSQLLSGYLYTFLRVRYNFISAVICHSTWNFITTVVPLLMGMLEKPYEKKTNDYYLSIKYHEFNDLKKQKLSVDSSNGKIFKIDVKQYSINHIVDTLTNKNRNASDFIIDLELNSKKGITKDEFIKIINQYDTDNKY